MGPEAWIIEEVEKEERPSTGLELELPLERADIQQKQKTESQRGVVVLDISPLAPNEIKI